MATISTDVATKQISDNTKCSPQEVGGRVRVAQGVISPGTGAAGTIINLVKLPKGARVLPTSKMYFAASQNSDTTFKVGDSVSDNRYFVAAAPGASAVTKDLDAAKLAPYSLASEGWIFATTAVNALTDNLIGFTIFWVLD